MRAFEPVVGGVAEQARQAGELLDQFMDEAAIRVRVAQRLVSPQPVDVVVNFALACQDDRIFQTCSPAIGPAVPIISAMAGVRHSRKAVAESPAGRRRKAARARSVVASG
jgi:hypothetical protein